jgi:hypothetical protein
MTQRMTPEQLRLENLAYVGTGGISQENRHRGFLPAFFDSETGRSVLSKFADGRVAPVHLLDGLPAEWIVARDRSGRVRSVKSSVIAGFVLDGWFYTREQAAKATLH